MQRYASTSAQLFVVNGENWNLLSYHTGQKLGLIAVSVNTATIADRDKNTLEEKGKKEA